MFRWERGADLRKDRVNVELESSQAFLLFRGHATAQSAIMVTYPERRNYNQTTPRKSISL